MRNCQRAVHAAGRTSSRATCSTSPTRRPTATRRCSRTRSASTSARERGHHLAFGFGRHFCLGAHLARMEVRALFKELLARLEHIELAGEPTWIRAYFVQGPKSIPIRYAFRS